MKYLPWGVLAIALLLGYGYHRQQVGELNGRIASLEHLKTTTDTVYKTLTKTRVLVKLRTDSLLRTDTLFHVDTVRVLVERERQACDQVISTCEQRVAVRDSIIKVLKKKPSVLSRIPWVAAGVLGGVILSK